MTSPDGAQTRVSGAVTEVTGRVTEVTGGDETPGAGGGDTTPPAGASTDLEIAAESDDGFTEDELTAEAGAVTIVFDNRDDGTAHNFTLYESPDSRDIEIDATPLVAGPATDEITVELQPGQYYFACQSHPEAMNGVLTVE